ncbi:urease accessory protein UreF [Thiohalorhabdus denitrificans]|uniref:Urease accessory protein UreF n=1 Tax=Thiohalorhabdus denitrificans TaxID=381306 RepID=A0A0P9C542_9GAMM|nr:urease accessory UreF family protein [Thiohalorhabdus denitrificans]KPV39964.1 urease accessory protein UreF [Thiohalorhabdus denitrificans]SCY09998.1 urease accessory protein [Thiohalorhabdus denitrificans]
MTSGLVRLLQLTSPALPVGAYAFSQGLEQAVAAGWVTGEESTGDWLGGQLEHGLGGWDLPVLYRLHDAWSVGDEGRARIWSRFLQAGRESGELLAEDRHLGQALARLLGDLGMEGATAWAGHREVTFAALFARAAVGWGIPWRECGHGFAWAWLENQVAAAVKLVPLGQTAGQRLQLALGDRIPGVVDAAAHLEDEDLGGTLPGLAAASAAHETQYTRLFRS